RNQDVGDAARGFERPYLAGEPPVREQTLEPRVPQVDGMDRAEGEVHRLMGMVETDALGVPGPVMDDVDVAIVTDRRSQRVEEEPVAGGRESESEDRRQVVLEISPRVAAVLCGVAIAGEVPVAPVERAGEPPARVLRVTLGAGDRRAIVPTRRTCRR